MAAGDLQHGGIADGEHTGVQLAQLDAHPHHLKLSRRRVEADAGGATLLGWRREMQDLTCGGVAHEVGRVARPPDEDEAEAVLGADDTRAVLAFGVEWRRPPPPYSYFQGDDVRRRRLKQGELGGSEGMVPLLEGARSAAEPREGPRRQAHEHLRDEVVGQRDATRRRGLAGRPLLGYSLPRLRRHHRAH